MANSHGRFVWYELMTTDVVAAKTFYAKVMGWNVLDVSMPGMPYALFAAGKTSVTGVLGLPKDAKKIGAKPRWMGYVAVDDVDAAAEKVKQLGGTVHVPPQNIPNISRFSIVADPQTATLALFKGLGPIEGQPIEPGQPGHVGWHELLAADWEKAFAFYEDLFGWQKADAEAGPLGTYQVFSAAGETIGGMFTKPSTVPIPFWLLYFGVADIDTAAERVNAAGGHVIEGPVEAPAGSWIARCTDPQGAMFALEGKRSQNTIGYFKRVPRDPSNPRGRRWYIGKTGNGD
jgi:uncharacterized protein